MSSKNLKIFIQICSHCKQHSWCTRHKEQVYLLLAKDIQTHVIQQHPDVQVLIVPVGGTKMGSFQISCQGINLFSKLKLGYFPHTNAVTQKISKFIEDYKNGKDLSSYQNNDQSPVKCNSNYNKSPSPKHSPMRKTNPTAFKISESSKKQQESNTHKPKQQNQTNNTQVKQTKQEPSNKKIEKTTQIKKQQVKQKVQNQTKVTDKQKNIQRGQVILPKQQAKKQTKNNNPSQKDVKQQKKQLEQPVKPVQNVKNIEKVQQKHTQQHPKVQNQNNKQHKQHKQQHKQPEKEKEQKKAAEEHTNFVIKEQVKHQKNEKPENIATQTNHHNHNDEKSSHKQHHQVKKQQHSKQSEQNYEQQFEPQKQSTAKLIDQKQQKKANEKVQIHQQHQQKAQTQKKQHHHQVEQKRQILSHKAQNTHDQVKNQKIQEKDDFLEDCRAAFSQYDKDKSGYLDKTQMNKFFNDLLDGLRLTTEKSQQFKAKFILQGDANQDGQIQFNELVAIARKILNP